MTLRNWSWHYKDNNRIWLTYTWMDLKTVCCEGFRKKSFLIFSELERKFWRIEEFWEYSCLPLMNALIKLQKNSKNDSVNWNWVICSQILFTKEKLKLDWFFSSYCQRIIPEITKHRICNGLNFLSEKSLTLTVLYIKKNLLILLQ